MEPYGLSEPEVLPHIIIAPQFYWFKGRTEMQWWACKTLTELQGSTHFKLQEEHQHLASGIGI